MTTEDKILAVLERQTKAFEGLAEFASCLKTSKSNRLSIVSMPTGYSMKDLVSALNSIADNAGKIEAQLEETNKFLSKLASISHPAK